MSRFKLIGLGMILAIAVIIVSALPGCVPISDAAEEPPSVLVVTLDSVHRMWPPARLHLADTNYSLSYDRGGYVKAIDFNYGNKSFCFIQPVVLLKQSTFKCACADNFTRRWELSKLTLFPSQFTVATMAYDWASGTWYFIDKMHRCLYVCDSTMQLQHCRILHRNVEDPRGLVVDPTPPKDDNEVAGFVFWSQNNTAPSRLARSDLAGDNIKGLLPEDCSGACTPKALTLDITNKLIFWVDGETDTVEQSNYDGSGRTSVYKIVEAYNTNIKVFSWFNSTLYLPGYRSIITKPRNSNETYTNVYGFPSTAAVYHQSRQPKVVHPCAENNGGCQHICTTAYRGVAAVARCLCRHGFQLDAVKHGVCTSITLETFMLVSRGAPHVVEVRAPLSAALAAPPAASHRPTVADVDTDSDYIYFFDTAWRQILRQKMDGSGRGVFIKDGLYECQGLAIDWMGGNLYWTDNPLGRITVARLSAPAQRRELVKEGSYHPYSIVLDPERGVMYWTSWAPVTELYGSIEMANMDGSARRKLVSEHVEKPNGLVLDSDKQVLYWCDTQLNKIESFYLASNKRTTILAAPQASIEKPYGLVLLDGDLLWSEQASGLLRRLEADGNVTLVDSMTPLLFDIRMISRKGRSGRNTCSANNGGCAELCLARPGGHSCACAAGRAPLATDATRCVEVESS